MPQFSSVQSLSSLRLFETPWTAAPGPPVHHQLQEFTQTHVHWVDDDIQPSHPLSSLSPPALNLSQHQGLFQWVSSLHRWPKYWSFSFSISPSNEYSRLISFRMDWLDLLAVQGTLKSLLQHHSSKASILWCLAFFIVQLSHPYTTTGKSIALTIKTFVSKVMSLLFNRISRLVSSSILGTYWPGEFLFQYPIILPFHTVHGVLKARVLKWFAIPFSSGPHSVRSLHHDPLILGCPTGMA